MAPSNPISSTMAPKYGDQFDAWNSSATGHQTAQHSLSSSTGWKQSRSMKLSGQLRSGSTGGERMIDFVLAGPVHWDEKAKALIPKDVRARARVSVADMLVSKRPQSSLRKKVSQELAKPPLFTNRQEINEEPSLPKTGIFDGLTIYVNGSTTPLISDHKLKYILAEHGAKISIHLGRRQVTHVILGNPCGKSGGIGAGGGLAATKIQKEIKRTGGCGIRYVSVQWVLESLEAGIRLPEARVSNLALASKRQRTVYGGIFQPDGGLSRPVDELIDGV